MPKSNKQTIQNIKNQHQAAASKNHAFKGKIMAQKSKHHKKHFGEIIQIMERIFPLVEAKAQICRVT